MRGFVRLLLILALAAAAAGAARAEATLSGDYRAEGRDAQGRAYAGQVRIAAQGRGYAIGWRLEDGGDYRGFGLKMDDVLGAVYWSDRAPARGAGIVLYRIQGEELLGLWLVGGAKAPIAGRENLKGSPELSGDYEITLGENPDGMTNYDGRVHMERRGDTLQVSWYTPRLAYVGNGIRIGDILIVGYALGPAPGTVAYCVLDGGLRGVWTYGETGRLGSEALTRLDRPAQPPPPKEAASCGPLPLAP